MDLGSNLFPAFPIALGDAVLFGSLVLVGMLAGEFFARLRLPRVTGYLLAGIALGAVLPGNTVNTLYQDARFFVDVALALVMFDLGRRLDWEWLARDRSLAVTSIVEVLLSFGAMFWMLRSFDFSPLESGIAAAIGISTSPAVGLLVTRDAHAEGQVTERSLTLTAVNTLIAVFTANMLLAGANLEYHNSRLLVVLHPLYLLAGSLVLGLVGAYAALLLVRLLGKREHVQFVLVMALILMVIGLAHMLKLSVLMALLVFGVASRRHRLLDVEWGHAAQLFYVVLFVVVGASLSWHALKVASGLGLLYVAVRVTGKLLGVFIVAPFSALRWRQSLWLGASLTPMSAVAVVLLQSLSGGFPEFSPRLNDVLMAAITYFELVGPLVMLFALRRAGETPPEERSK
jgi:Kef-type K+ transport system membrane component KefB